MVGYAKTVGQGFDGGSLSTCDIGRIISHEAGVTFLMLCQSPYLTRGFPFRQCKISWTLASDCNKNIPLAMKIYVSKHPLV